MEKYRYIPYIVSDAATQMAIDEMLLRRVVKGEWKFVLRFYHFDPIAITIGYHQKYERVYRDGSEIDIVRRITGGRAVYHNGDITYSVIASNDVFPDGSVVGTYRIISSYFAKGFNMCGVDVRGVPPSHKDKSRSELCFASSSMYEFLLKGEKIMGSAQYRLKDAFIQQGTILVYRPTIPLNKVMNTDVEELPNVELLEGVKINRDKFCNYVKDVFSDGLKNSFIEKELSNDEKEEVNYLVKHKYGNEGWNKHKEGYYGFRSEDRSVST